uniref:50S ribosomal protein L31 n=1 Tax=Nocardioides sp. SYSU DS0651 TaxID=3415955 RepID=UPI003F4C0295
DPTTTTNGARRAGPPRGAGPPPPHPVVDVDVTVHSHPFWTGRGRVVDSEGRVQAFERRYGRTSGGGRDGAGSRR